MVSIVFFLFTLLMLYLIIINTIKNTNIIDIIIGIYGISNTLSNLFFILKCIKYDRMIPIIMPYNSDLKL